MNWRCPYRECDGSGLVVEEATNTAYDCRCRPQRKARARARSLQGVIPKLFRNVSFERAPIVDLNPHVVREVRRYVGDLERNLDAGRGLWFMGDVGTAKTALAMLVSREALEAGRSVAIYSLPRLLAVIRETFDDPRQGSYLALLESLETVDLLHVDDVGAEKTSPWVLEQLYSIVNARYEEQRAVLLTTNLDPEALREQITERTYSRLVAICGDPLPLFGHDLREQGAHQLGQPPEPTRAAVAGAGRWTIDAGAG